MSLLDLIKESRLLGPRKLAFRVGWEVSNRTGLRSMLEPVGPYPVPTGRDDHDSWFGRLRQNHPLRLVRRLVVDGAADALIRDVYSSDAVSSIHDRADAVERGEFELFQAFTTVGGTPPNWHLEPRRRRSWPRGAHWSTLLSHEDRNGDIKLTWELNRFIHVYALIRAYAVDKDDSRAQTFASHLRSWEESNVFRAGVNWASGQELAIRVLSWTYGVAGLGASEAFTEADFQRYRRLCYAHGRHIFENLGFARHAVPNNHLLAEALGLYVIGTTFEFDESADWVEAAVALFDDLLDQFDADGGYCQNSHTYARFAVQMWLEVLRWRPQRRYAVLPVLRRATDLLRTFTSSAGRVPNWGFNDGSALNVWCESDYQDFRPTLDAVDFACGVEGVTCEESRENLFWLFGYDEASERAAPSPHVADFPATGLYYRARGNSRAVVRAGPMHQRTGHADQMHVDVWFGDTEVACDAGSYSYHYDQAFHRWAAGPQSHNVVTIDGFQPMKLLRKFKWQGFQAAEVVRSSDDAIVLAYPAYSPVNVTWTRTVEVSGDSVSVRDSLQSSTRPQKFRLHWLLRGVGWKRNGQTLTRGDIAVSFGGAEFVIDIVEGSDGMTQGWQSRYYGLREPCTSVAVYHTGAAVEYVTRFSQR